MTPVQPALSEKVRGTIVHRVLDSGLFGDACSLFSLERGDGSKRHRAQAALAAEPDVHVVCTIPTHSRNIYITLSDGDPSLIGQLFATLEEMEADGCTIRPGNVQLFDDPALQARDICGVLMLPVAVSNLLGFLPETVAIGADTYRFLLVVFLSPREHVIWKTHGHDALMDDFIANDKDLIAFGSNPD